MNTLLIGDVSGVVRTVANVARRETVSTSVYREDRVYREDVDTRGVSVDVNVTCDEEELQDTDGEGMDRERKEMKLHGDTPSDTISSRALGEGVDVLDEYQDGDEVIRL